MRAPDILGPVYGWRLWGIAHKWGVGAPRLHSPLFGRVQWPTDEWLTATCRDWWCIYSDKATGVPHRYGYCGIYLMNRPSNAIRRGRDAAFRLPPRPLLLGLTAARGRYVQCTDGWRVEQARLAAVVYTTGVDAPRRACRAVADTYDVPFYDASHTRTPSPEPEWLTPHPPASRLRVENQVINDVLALVRK